MLGIGNKKVLSLPVNKQVNKQLRNRGFEVIEVDITEIIKSEDPSAAAHFQSYGKSKEYTGLIHSKHISSLGMCFLCIKSQISREKVLLEIILQSRFKHINYCYSWKYYEFTVKIL